jgi:hypothetical protein
MANIAEEALTWSIRHLLKHGDTDIFPYPLEFKFFADYHVQIAKFLAGLDVFELQINECARVLGP